MSKCEIIFTGNRVHFVLDLSLAKAGLKRRIRHSCSDLSILGILMFPAKLMGKKNPNQKNQQGTKCFKLGPAWIKNILISFASPKQQWLRLRHVSRLNKLIYILLQLRVLLILLMTIKGCFIVQYNCYLKKSLSIILQLA